MPHVIIKYTANVEADARIPELTRVPNDVLIGYTDVLPIGGIRTHVLCLDQYRVADGVEDDAFIRVTFRIKAGWRKAVTGPICAVIFTAMCAYLVDVFARRYLRLTLELVKLGTHGSRIENNVHTRFARAAEP